MYARTGGQLRLLEADTLEHRMDAVPVGKPLHAFDRFIAAFADDVARAELARERDSVWVTTEDDDLLRAEPLGGNHAAETDSTVADDSDSLAGRHLGRDGGVMARAHHV
jgi:hypothetical protein